MKKQDLINEIVSSIPAKRAFLYCPELEKLADDNFFSPFDYYAARHGVPAGVRPYAKFVDYNYQVEVGESGPGPATIVYDKKYTWKPDLLEGYSINQLNKLKNDLSAPIESEWELKPNFFQRLAALFSKNETSQDNPPD